jgi:hypothetical protein
MAYLHANILLCTLIHTQREEMTRIDRALLYQDTLEELYIEELPTSGGTMHHDHCRDLQTLLTQSRYYGEILAVKGASGVAKTGELNFSKSIEPPPLPVAQRLHRTMTPKLAAMTMARGHCRGREPGPAPCHFA